MQSGYDQIAMLWNILSVGLLPIELSNIDDLCEKSFGFTVVKDYVREKELKQNLRRRVKRMGSNLVSSSYLDDQNDSLKRQML